MSGPTNRQQALDQRRAKHAWQAVQLAVSEYGEKSEKARQFGRAAKKLPARIMAAGLGQSLAFLLAKDKTPLLLAALGDWVLDKRRDEKCKEQLLARPTAEQQRRLLKAVMDGNSTTLRQSTDEALTYLRWLVRFADAEKLTVGED